MKMRMTTRAWLFDPLQARRFEGASVSVRKPALYMSSMQPRPVKSNILHAIGLEQYET